jgi:hypothetical protein
VGIKELKDSITDLGGCNFNLATVVLDESDMVLIAMAFFLLLNGRYDAPRGTLGSKDILVGN